MSEMNEKKEKMTFYCSTEMREKIVKAVAGTVVKGATISEVCVALIKDGFAVTGLDERLDSMTEQTEIMARRSKIVQRFKIFSHGIMGVWFLVLIYILIKSNIYG